MVLAETFEHFVIAFSSTFNALICKFPDKSETGLDNLEAKVQAWYRKAYSDVPPMCLYTIVPTPDDVAYREIFEYYLRESSIKRSGGGECQDVFIDEMMTNLTNDLSLMSFCCAIHDRFHSLNSISRGDFLKIMANVGVEGPPIPNKKFKPNASFCTCNTQFTSATLIKRKVIEMSDVFNIKAALEGATPKTRTTKDPELANVFQNFLAAKKSVSVKDSRVHEADPSVEAPTKDKHQLQSINEESVFDQEEVESTPRLGDRRTAHEISVYGDDEDFSKEVQDIAVDDDGDCSELGMEEGELEQTVQAESISDPHIPIHDTSEYVDTDRFRTQGNSPEGYPLNFEQAMNELSLQTARANLSRAQSLESIAKIKERLMEIEKDQKEREFDRNLNYLNTGFEDRSQKWQTVARVILKAPPHGNHVMVRRFGIYHLLETLSEADCDKVFLGKDVNTTSLFDTFETRYVFRALHDIIEFAQRNDTWRQEIQSVIQRNASVLFKPEEIPEPLINHALKVMKNFTETAEDYTQKIKAAHLHTSVSSGEKRDIEPLNEIVYAAPIPAARPPRQVIKKSSAPPQTGSYQIDGIFPGKQKGFGRVTILSDGSHVVAAGSIQLPLERFLTMYPQASVPPQ